MIAPSASAAHTVKDMTLFPESCRKIINTTVPALELGNPYTQLIQTIPNFLFF